LPQPDSPTRPDDLARRDREVDAVDRAHDLLAHVRAGDVRDARGEVERLDEAPRHAAQLDQRDGRQFHATSGWWQRLAASGIAGRDDHRRRLAADRVGAAAALAERAARRQADQRRRHAGDLLQARAATLRDGTLSSRPCV
jgi:hypothetical protein